MRSSCSRDVLAVARPRRRKRDRQQGHQVESPFGSLAAEAFVQLAAFGWLLMPWVLRMRSPVSSQWQNSSKSSCHVLGSVSKISNVA